jgi:hypothetical protein
VSCELPFHVSGLLDDSLDRARGDDDRGSGISALRGKGCRLRWLGPAVPSRKTSENCNYSRGLFPICMSTSVFVESDGNNKQSCMLQDRCYPSVVTGKASYMSTRLYSYSTRFSITKVRA